MVSGQNVVFVLVLARPLLARLRWPGRWTVTIALIGAFALVTRFEPSILRASAMAAISVTAAARGLPNSPVRILALAVAILVLVDPLLVHAVGFQLSVGASLAIIVLAAPLAERLGGPRLVADALAVTIAAQVGVAPVLVARFGGIPVASFIANPIAVPVAGLVTSWGLPAGIVAGLGGPDVASVVHLPTGLAIAWVAWVARRCSALPLGELGVAHVVALVAVGAIWWRTPLSGVRHLAVAIAVLVVVAPALALRSPPALAELDGGARVERIDGRTEVVVAGCSLPDLLAGLRRAGVRRIDLLRVDARRASEVTDALAHRWTVVEVEPLGGGP